MDRAPLSVVIPTYNRKDLIRDAIDSVLAQTLPPAEVIVIDDGSRVDPTEVLKPYGDRILLHRQRNAGHSAARNNGMAMTTQPYVALLDDDDVWHPRKVELQMRVLERDAKIGLIASEQFDWPCETFPEIPRDWEGKVREVTWEHLAVRTTIPMSSVIIRRDVLDRAGGFDPGLFGSEDREWFLRIAAVAPVYTVGVPLSGYRDTPGSLCKDAGVREPVMLEVLRRVDRQGLWRRRWLLRRKAYSYVHHSLAVVHAWAGNHGGAVKQELKSLAWFPLPYRRDEVNTPFARPKRLAVNLLRLARLKGADRGAAAKPVPAVNALQKLLQNGDRAAPAQSSPGPSCF